MRPQPPLGGVNSRVAGGGGSGFDRYPAYEPGVGRGFGGGGGRGFGGGMVNGGFSDRRGDVRGREVGVSGRSSDFGYAGGRGFDSGRGGRTGFGGERGGRGGFDGGRGGGGRGGRHDLDSLPLPKPEFGNLVPFEKNFYVESPSVSAMTEQDTAQYRASRDITVEGHDIPKPIRVFRDANFPGMLKLIIYIAAFVGDY